MLSSNSSLSSSANSRIGSSPRTRPLKPCRRDFWAMRQSCPPSLSNSAQAWTPPSPHSSASYMFSYFLAYMTFASRNSSSSWYHVALSGLSFSPPFPDDNPDTQDLYHNPSSTFSSPTLRCSSSEDLSPGEKLVWRSVNGRIQTCGAWAINFSRPISAAVQFTLPCFPPMCIVTANNQDTAAALRLAPAAPLLAEYTVREPLSNWTLGLTQKCRLPEWLDWLKTAAKNLLLLLKQSRALLSFMLFLDWKWG